MLVLWHVWNHLSQIMFEAFKALLINRNCLLNIHNPSEWEIGRGFSLAKFRFKHFFYILKLQPNRNGRLDKSAPTFPTWRPGMKGNSREMWAHAAPRTDAQTGTGTTAVLASIRMRKWAMRPRGTRASARTHGQMGSTHPCDADGGGCANGAASVCTMVLSWLERGLPAIPGPGRLDHNLCRHFPLFKCIYF